MNTKIFAAIGAVALCGAVATTASADVESANIVGYSHTVVDSANGYAIFTPQFRGIGATKLNIDDLVPVLPNGNVVKTGGKVKLQFMNNKADGLYSAGLEWVNNVGWSYNGSTKHEDTIEIAEGESIVIYNIVKANKTTGVEAYAPPASVDFVKISIRHSGEVNLQPQTTVPANQYALCGNVSFTEAVNLDNLVPVLPNGNVVKTGGKVKLQFMNNKADGLYSAGLEWVNNVGWSYNGSTKHEDTIVFAAGEGFVVYNIVKANKTTGVEAYAPPASVDFTPIVLKKIEQ